MSTPEVKRPRPTISQPVGYGLVVFLITSVYVLLDSQDSVFALVGGTLLGLSASGLSWRLINMGAIPRAQHFGLGDVFRILVLATAFWIFQLVGRAL